MTAVTVVISAKQVGDAFIIPYSHSGGLQTRRVAGVKKTVVYKIPAYEVRILGAAAGRDKYKAIRFGLRNKGGAPPASRGSDAGLSAKRTCKPTWVPTYSPHSFAGTARRGAWRLLPKAGFLIHEGGDTAAGQVGGSLGCVEILDGLWDTFLGEIEALGGWTCAEIGKARKLTVEIEAATYPTATFVGLF